ncbi:uncharacterized protein DUF1016 [Chromohalobacter marismortui]|uniref:Uncharacterized protein DUF1016 n=1 Tax=Chromohalobacter marismortui TaxID=42055 RepID=A0A4V6Q456_9GAMM|nr:MULTISPECIES: DUF1016 N-terminal domain-containing protein [Chromohalobacter]MCI0509212.1 DUF1016 N-terminal domain-containing protein [Chromohalobacter sp.]TDU23896.1 uncharacterized protein DUF1016 [Chromohalobacter marismortui]
MSLEQLPNPAGRQLLGDIRHLIEQSRSEVALSVYSVLALLYWHIGQCIQSEVLQGERAAYGEQLDSPLAKQLVAKYGCGFSTKDLRHMLRFAKAFPDEEIVSGMLRQLSLPYIKALLYINDSLKRDFYLQMCQLKCWKTRALQANLHMPFGRSRAQLAQRAVGTRAESASEGADV